MRGLLGNGGAGAALLLLAVEVKEVNKWTVNRSGGRVGGSSKGLRRKDSRDVWLRGQTAGDECHPRVDHFLKPNSHCSLPFRVPSTPDSETSSC